MKWANYRKKKLQEAITYYEEKRDEQLANFRKCAQTYDVDKIVSFLPTMINNIQDTDLKVQSLKDKLSLMRFFYDDKE